jgi:uncharacterized protein YycO
MIVLQFSGNTSPVGTIARVLTHHWVSHVAFVLPSGELLDSTITHKGVAVHDWCPRSDKSFRVERWIADIPDSCLDYAKEQVGKPYDWLGVVGIVLKRNWQNDKHWFCSELVAASCIKAGYPLIDVKNPGRVTPSMIYQSKLIKQDTSFIFKL